ncbi:MerR family transcriptional regulator [Spiroplasma alleghenense]|uniref:HTH merR-type domain-containing protein n=1 Tax=Spiroplasma alleghenense TaxID=216931 RepID=A0A345Z500_9MOLU|nr:MerR family transcriptional regulator [Spiroplasma alleghenense]AXK51679.1 hypothetical protein SALLE_v1c10090 [Spiroplasma alleghenense]
MINIFDSKFIRRNAATSHKQITLYVGKGLLPKTIIKEENKIELNLEELNNLFKIKMLQKIGFSLDNIKVFLDNLTSERNLFLIFHDFLESEKKGLDKLVLTLNEIEQDNENLAKKEAFYFSNKIIIAPYIAIDVFEIKKKWFEDDEKKNFLRKWRKTFYSLFLNYESNLEIEKDKVIFEKLDSLDNFFSENSNFNSKIYFFSFINWLTCEPRYIKEMKRICKYNYSNEITNATIKWFCKKY